MLPRRCARCGRLPRDQRVAAPSASASICGRCVNSDAASATIGRSRGSLRALLVEDVDQHAEVPERPLLAAREVPPHRIAVRVVIAHDRAQVVELVGRRDEQHRSVRLVAQVRVIRLPCVRATAPFARPSSCRRASRCRPCTTSATVGAEQLLDAPQLRLAALIFRGVVQQRRDRFVLAPAVGEDGDADAEQMGHVGNARQLAHVVLVQQRTRTRAPCENGPTGSSFPPVRRGRG